MAMTVTVSRDVQTVSGGRVIAGTAVASASYTSAGETLDLSSYLSGTPFVMVAGGAGYHPNHNGGTAAAGVVRFYNSGANNADVLVQVANSTNLAAVTVQFFAIGTSA